MVSRKCPNNRDNTLVKRGDSQVRHYARKDHIENKRHLNCLNGAGKSHVMQRIPVLTGDVKLALLKRCCCFRFDFYGSKKPKHEQERSKRRGHR